jgi:protein-tyrosine phosphatase
VEPAPAPGVLFVCLGNICRSPTAEGVFRAAAERAGVAQHVRIDSAGTGDWHIGEPPDRRAIAAARQHGIELAHLRARQVEGADFARFDWILAMDRSNLASLVAMRPASYRGHLGLFLDFAPELGVAEVPDPWTGGPHDFARVLDLVEHASAALLAQVRESISRGLHDSR